MNSPTPPYPAIDLLIRATPLLLLVSVVGSTIFSAGYFRFFGYEWITLLTAKDIVTGSAIALAPLLIGMSMQRIGGHFPTPRVLDATQRSPVKITDPLLRQVIFLSLASLSFLAFLGTFYLLFIHPFSPRDFARCALPLIFFNATSMILSFLQLSETERQYSAIGFLIYTLTMTLYSFGAMLGAQQYTSTPNYTMTLKNQAVICGTLLHPTERGVIFFKPDTHVTEFVKWDSIEILSKTEKCALSIK